MMKFYNTPIHIPEEKRIVFLRVNSGDSSPYIKDGIKWNENAKRVEVFNSEGIYGVNGGCVSIGYVMAFISIFSFCKYPKILLMETNEDDVLYNSFTEMATCRANILQVFTIEQFERYAKHYNVFLPMIDLYSKCKPLRESFYRGHYSIWRLKRLKLYKEMYQSLSLKFPEHKYVYEEIIYKQYLRELSICFKSPFVWLIMVCKGLFLGKQHDPGLIKKPQIYAHMYSNIYAHMYK